MRALARRPAIPPSRRRAGRCAARALPAAEGPRQALLPLLLLTAAALLALAAGPAGASYPSSGQIAGETGDETSYGYLRTVEGPGRLVQAASGARVQVEANYPVLAGDLLEVDPGGRLEISLPDFNVVRLGGGTELLLDRLALSADSGDDETALRLLRGEIQLLVHDLLPVAERPRVDTANATIYLQGSGVYRIATDGYGWTEVVVRRGFAEIATEAGSSVVRGGEQAWIEGGRWPRIDIDLAADLDELERWGAELDGELGPAELAAYDEAPGDGYVDDHLTYSAAPLSRHGSWVVDDGYRAWRPAVGASWRPYEVGYWTDTPSGLFWVSSEPWGWITYHYGSWVPSPSYGWVWRPGYSFSPAWVYWYWGPSYVAWVPVGYYTRHYHHYGHGFRFGIHGWAGGSWGHFADWTFCSTRTYRRRDLHHHLRRGHRLARDTRTTALERGLIATDSRPEVRQRAFRRGGAGRSGADSLPDVTAFVARRPQLPPEVSERVFSERRAVSRDELFERPNAPRSRRADDGARGTRAALPRDVGRERLDAWRRESGQVRGRGADAARPDRPRARPAGPPGSAAEPSRWWENRPGRAAPRGTGRPPEASGGPAPRPGQARPPGDERPPVVRRVWEGIRDRQRARPPSAAPSPRAPAPRRPTAEPSSPGSRRPPAAQPRSGTPRRPSADRGRSQGPSRSSADRGGSQGPRRSSADRGGSQGSRRSSADRSSSSSRRQTSARGGDRGSSRRSSASSGRRSGGNRSSESSSRGRSARRRPPN